jgi:hypothetical protein
MQQYKTLDFKKGYVKLTPNQPTPPLHGLRREGDQPRDRHCAWKAVREDVLRQPRAHKPGAEHAPPAAGQKSEHRQTHDRTAQLGEFRQRASSTRIGSKAAFFSPKASPYSNRRWHYEIGRLRFVRRRVLGIDRHAIEAVLATLTPDPTPGALPGIDRGPLNVVDCVQGDPQTRPDEAPSRFRTLRWIGTMSAPYEARPIVTAALCDSKCRIPKVVCRQVRYSTKFIYRGYVQRRKDRRQEGRWPRVENTNSTTSSQAS